jgi:SAM-dependent methyltransferase
VTWDGPTAQWWRTEVGEDPAYRRDVDPLLEALLDGAPEGPRLDIGCGDGRLLDQFAAFGVDSSLDLVRGGESRRTVIADLARLPFAEAQWSVSFVVLVVEHLAEVGQFFTEAARVTASGGVLALVVNHPIYTAPGSGPFLDPEDGEVLWRWGSYLTPGSTREPAGSGSVEFHHRSMADLLSAAAAAGWQLERVIERALTPDGDALLEAQAHVPRLLGLRWARAPQTTVEAGG